MVLKNRRLLSSVFQVMGWNTEMCENSYNYFKIHCRFGGEFYIH